MDVLDGKSTLMILVTISLVNFFCTHLEFLINWPQLRENKSTAASTISLEGHGDVDDLTRGFDQAGPVPVRASAGCAAGGSARDGVGGSVNEQVGDAGGGALWDKTRSF